MDLNDHPLHEAFELILRFEGCHFKPYLDPIGLPTVGYGHLISPAEFDKFGITRITPNRFDVSEARTLTQDEVDDLLAIDLNRFILGVHNLVTVDLSPRQFGALVSWSFNLGLGNLKRSTLLKVVNANEHAEAPYQIKRWDKAGGRVLKGLVRRRAAEAELYELGTN